MTEIATTMKTLTQQGTTGFYATTMTPLNFKLTGVSPAKRTGVTIAGLTVDYAGHIITDPPSMGAYSYPTVGQSMTKSLNLLGVGK
jgi:hypothetical protein